MNNATCEPVNGQCYCPAGFTGEYCEGTRQTLAFVELSPVVHWIRVLCRDLSFEIHSYAPFLWYFDFSINKLSHVLASWSVFRALFTWSRRTKCAEDDGLFIFIFAYPQINGARKPGHVENVLALSLSLLIFFSFPSHSVLPLVPCILSSIVSGTLPPVDSNSTKAPLSHDSSTTNSVTTTTAVIAVAVAMLAAILILVLVYLKRKNKIPKPKMTKR